MPGRPSLLLLGEPRLRTPREAGDVEEPLTGSTSTTLLALLALEPQRVVTLDRLLDQVWHEEAREAGRGRVHVQISRLRQRLAVSGLRIDSRNGGYVLAERPETVDLHRFNALVSSARDAASGGDWAAVLASAAAAAELWRGEPFAGARAAALDLERTNLLERRRSLLQLRCQALLALDSPDEALLLASEIRESDVYGEFGVWAAMTALTRLGRRVDALEVFDGYRQTMADELGLDPSQELQELHRAVLRDDVRLASVTPGPDVPDRRRTGAGPAGARLHHNVAQRQLVGRDRELSHIDRQVRDLCDGRSSVLLIEGEAGIGRSALARHAAVEAERVGLRVVRARGLDSVPATSLSVWRHVGSRLGLAEGRLGSLDNPISSAVVADLVDAVLSAVRDEPTFLVMDDLHCVDDGSAQVLQWLVSEIWDEPLAVLATRRFHGAPSSAAKELAWTSLSQHDLATTLEIGPLDLDAVAALAGVQKQTAELLLRRTGGNPRLVGELLPSVAAGTAGGELPCGVLSMVRSRLTALPPLTGSLLTVGATVGRRFDTRQVAEALGLEPGVVDDALRPAVEAGLVRPLHRGAWWSFRHELEHEGMLELIADCPHLVATTLTSGAHVAAGGE